jgi:hypothetical protein
MGPHQPQSLLAAGVDYRDSGLAEWQRIFALVIRRNLTWTWWSLGDPREAAPWRHEQSQIRWLPKDQP